MQVPAAYLTKVEDEGHIVADLLHLLENVNGDDLASFLESEHRELLRLRDQVRIYKAALSELANHLQHVFCAVGGLSALPLSPPTRSTLVQPTSPGLPMTPLSPGNSVNKTRSRYVIPLLRSPTSTAFKLQQAPSRPSLSTRDTAAQTDDQLDGLVTELQHTVGEQQTDIEDLELSLRERRTQVRVLRKQLRDKELRQFAVASDCAGLRRTASIMMESGSGFLAQMDAAGNWPPADTMPNMVAEDAAEHQCAVTDGRLTRAPSESSLASDISPSTRSTSTASSHGGDIRESGVTGAMPRKHRPSAYINGWPVYDDDDDAPRSANHAKHISAAGGESNPHSEKDNQRPAVKPLPSTNNSMGTKSVSGLSTPRSSQLSSVEPVAAATPETCASTATRSPSLHQPPPLQPPRTPSLFVSAVAKTPRRIYSRLSNRLKKM
ncbi:hypothetical protein GGH93_002749 [Coemansia aciculifera]|nr:hypothetical protein GGH93_002749 [Coemansia aciculifera]